MARAKVAEDVSSLSELEKYVETFKEKFPNTKSKVSEYLSELKRCFTKEESDAKFRGACEKLYNGFPTDRQCNVKNYLKNQVFKDRKAARKKIADETTGKEELANMASPSPVTYSFKDFEEEINRIGTNEIKALLADLKKCLEIKSVDNVKNLADKLLKEILTKAGTGMSEDAQTILSRLRVTGSECDVTVESKSGTTTMHVYGHKGAESGMLQGDQAGKGKESLAKTFHGGLSERQRLKEDNKRLSKANDNKIASLEEVLKVSQLNVEQLEKEMEISKQSIEQLEKDNKTSQQTIEQLEKEKKTAKDAYEKSCADKMDMERSFNSFLHNKDLEIAKLESFSEQLQQINGQFDNKLRKANKETEGLKDQLQQLAEDNAKQKQKLSEEIHRLHRENKDLKSRVSELAGAKLMDNNPDIADLSDPNRALKLGEKFSSLYDDDWTDAYQTYTEKFTMKEDEAIQFLLQILLKTYEFCQKVADEQMDCLCNVFENPCQDIPKALTMKPQKDKTQITQKHYKDLKDLRKQIGLKKAGSITKQYVNKEYEEVKKGDKKSKSMLDETKGYYEKCVEVCWPMVLHDPPVRMEYPIKPGIKIDGNRFRLYGGNGDVLEYLVWPPLLVEGGGLLAKGVAKPKKTPRTVKKP